MEGKWGQFLEAVEKVTKLTIPLQKVIENVEAICEKYRGLLREEGATPEECDELRQLSERLTEIKEDLENVREKEASKEIVIEFVGATSSGKSSLINAILRERRLPVGFMQTTMCTIKVCTTEDAEWSIDKISENGDKERLSNGNDDKTVRDLLSKMSGQENEHLRGKKDIGPRTIIQVNWPLSKCNVLPRNVVLCDTPGFGENDEDIEVVTQSCKKADIIVAVMDCMSPSRERLLTLVKEVNCQFTFGVFTKWDECLEKAKKEGEKIVRNVCQTAKDYKEEFRNALEGKGKVYFVNVKNVGHADEGFQKFEHKLATSATKLKGETITQQAKSVSSKSNEVCTELKNVIETRKKKKLDCLKRELDSIEKDSTSLTTLLDSITGKDEKDLELFSDDAVQPLLKKVEDDMLKGTPEEEAVSHFLKEINGKIQGTLSNQRGKIGKAFEEWKQDIEFPKFQSLNMTVSDASPQLPNQTLFEHQYNCYRDPNYYYTNNFICAVVVGVLVIASPAALVAAGAGAGAAALTGEALVQGVMMGGAAGGAVGGAVGAAGGFLGEIFNGFRYGDRLKRRYPISNYKLNCWKYFLEDELRKLHQKCKKVIRDENESTCEEIRENLKSAKSEKSAEIDQLSGESHRLTELVTQLADIHESLQTTNKGFDELMAELQSKAEGKIDDERNSEDDWSIIMHTGTKAMSATGSAVSTTEERWQGFTEISGKVRRELTENIQIVTKVTEEVEKICDDDSETVKKLHDIRADLESVQAKVASKEVAIAFVGRTSSGKSSLINALLRDNRLPVGRLQTTMCLIIVRTTSEKTWSVDKIEESGKKERLSDLKGKKGVKELLDKLSGEDERMTHGINAHSSIQVNWPLRFCSLPENVVLIDTPGLEESKDCDQVVIDYCKKADIIVAVMDGGTPSIQSAAEMLKKVNRHFTFGVFTKWDVYAQPEEDEEEDDDDENEEGQGEKKEAKQGKGVKEEKGKEKQARELYGNNFRKSVNLEDKVYFVDVKQILTKEKGAKTTCGTQEFLKFEKHLADSAKSLKGFLLIQDAKAVILQPEKVFEEFQRDIEKRRTEKKEALDSLQSKIDFMKEDHASLQELSEGVKSSKQLWDDILNDEAIVNLVEEFDNVIKENKSEDEIIKKFLDKANHRIRISVDGEDKKVFKKYKLWKDNVKSDLSSLLTNHESLPCYEVPQLLRQELPKDCYNNLNDFHTYVTSSTLWGGLCGAAAAGAAGVALPTLAAAGALEIAGASGVGKLAIGAAGSIVFTLATAADKHASLGLGGAIRRWVLISPKKRKAWKQFLSGELKKLRKHESQKSPLKEIRQISSNMKAAINKMTVGSSENMKKLSSEISNLETSIANISRSRNRLNVVTKQLDKLQLEARSVDTVSPDDQTENQSAADRCGTFV